MPKITPTSENTKQLKSRERQSRPRVITFEQKKLSETSQKWEKRLHSNQKAERQRKLMI